MHIDKFILWVAGVVALSGIGILSVEALNISTSSFNKWLPVFKTVFLRSEWKDTINGSVNPEFIKLDNSWLYISPSALWASLSTVLKMNASNTAQLLQVVNGDIVNDAITTTKILDWWITNDSLADVWIEARHILNATIDNSKFDPALQFPTWQIYYLYNVCASGKAVTSVNNWTATCTDVPNGLPTCSEGQWPVYLSGSRTCQTMLVSNSGFIDPNWTWFVWGNIRSIRPGNVWVWLNNPSTKLNVSWSFEVLWYAEETVYCYATDSWIPISMYNAWSCAWCNSGFVFNSNINLCEETSCAGSGSVSYTAIYIYEDATEVDICNNTVAWVVYISSSDTWTINTEVFSNAWLSNPVPAWTFIKEQWSTQNFQVNWSGRLVPTWNSC